MEGSSFAPTYKVPLQEVVLVEHPCIVKNLERGIDILGGPSAIKEVLEPGSTSSLGLTFHPENPDPRPILSFNNQTDNILLRITVPKRIGKRKRDSNDAFVPLDTSESQADARCLIQSLQENKATRKVEPLGTIRHSHIWRSMPDFVYFTQGSEFMSKVRSNILPRDLSALKQFDMDRKYGRRSTEAIPPPVLSAVSIPQLYSYRQSPSAKEMVNSETGQRALKLTDRRTNVTTFMISVHDCDEIYPTCPDPTAPPLANQSKAVRDLHPILTELFNQRPVWTRRALLNSLPEDIVYDKLRFTIGYVAFVIRIGPWRDSLCKFGVDPRTSFECRKYQTLMIQMPGTLKAPRSNDWCRSADKTSHIFTGELPQAHDGSMWQLCDIEDPQLKAQVNINDSQLRSECETKLFGWYQNGTFAKLRTAMKTKIDALLRGEKLDDSAFERFLTVLPDHLKYLEANDLEVGNPDHGYIPVPMTDLEMEMAKQYRTLTRYRANRETREVRGLGGSQSLGDEAGGEEENEEDAAFDEPSPDGPPMSQEATAADAGEVQMNESFQSTAFAPGGFSTTAVLRPTAFEEAWNHTNATGMPAGQMAPETSAPSTPIFEEAWQESAGGRHLHGCE